VLCTARAISPGCFFYALSRLADGSCHGFFKEYYESGVLKEEGSCTDGKLSGVFKTYSEKGNLLQEIVMEKKGVVKTYYENGKLKLEAHIEDGKLLSKKEYDEEGRSLNKDDHGIYTVERVIDGDTLKLTNGEVVKLIGIKAPPTDMEEVKKEVMATGQDLETITKMGLEAMTFSMV